MIAFAVCLVTATLACYSMRLAFARKTPPFDRLLFLFSKWTPELSDVLVIESGSRKAATKFLSELYRIEEPRRLDVLTCYRTAPEPFDTLRGKVFYTYEAQTGAARAELFRILSQSGYSAICVLCTGDRIMTKWKWAAAVRIPAKLMIVNENADCFWVDRGHLRNIKDMLIERTGVRRMTPLRIAGQAIAFPFTLLILIAYAGYMETRRVLREL